ncbi:MAG: S24/S26 family peptidase [Bacteriovorax sp.]|jgi:hypothetical protein
MKTFWINLKGSSMSPLLIDQDEILIESVAWENLMCGDLVLFFDQETKELILHRLIDLSFQTKGDLSLCAETISREGYFGRAVGYRRVGHYRALPATNSRFNSLFVLCSKMRMKGPLTRKLARMFFIVLTRVFEFCNEKTRTNHSEAQMLFDP